MKNFLLSIGLMLLGGGMAFFFPFKLFNDQMRKVIGENDALLFLLLVFDCILAGVFACMFIYGGIGFVYAMIKKWK